MRRTAASDHAGEPRSVDGHGVCIHVFNAFRHFDEESFGAPLRMGFRSTDRFVEIKACAGRGRRPRNAAAHASQVDQALQDLRIRNRMRA
jgi:hypothetical protein